MSLALDKIDVMGTMWHVTYAHQIWCEHMISRPSAKVKVTMSNMCFMDVIWVKVKGHIGQSQISFSNKAGNVFSAYSAISAFLTRIFDPPEISTNLGSKWTHK